MNLPILSNGSWHLGLPDLLRPVINATLTREGHVARCDPGTRLKVIAKIEQLLDGFDKRGAICWLSGPAGYGKSAVAQIIAERYAAKGRLLGCFFFLRGAGERSRISCLIPTLAHQISLSVPAVKPLLEKALQAEPAMLGPSVSLVHQFQKLIIEPIHSTTSTVLPNFGVFSLAKQRIFVIDALDECNDKDGMATFIDALLNAFPARSCLPFRILLTSRVEEHIRKKFDYSEARVLHHLDLEDFDARSDIQAYFEREFARILNKHHPMMQTVPKPWPSSKDLTELLDKAGSSFAFARTLIQFIGENDVPHKALQQLLESEANGLDPLYKQVLSSASGMGALHQILGTIMILENNQSISFLSSLLNLQHEEVMGELLGVQSIIKIPGHDDLPIMLFHTSLRDFLTIKSRSAQYFIDPPLQHLHLAMRCLKHLTEYPSKYFFEGGVVNYACFYWPYHILLGLQKQESNVDEKMMSSLENLIEVLLKFKGKTWYNTILTVEVSMKTRMLSCVRDGRDAIQVSYCNSQMVITLLTCIRHCRGQWQQRI